VMAMAMAMAGRVEGARRWAKVGAAWRGVGAGCEQGRNAVDRYSDARLGIDGV
jgi:hypothetical protein